MIDEHSTPTRWKAVLRAIQERGFPEAIIAGGALRDLDHGREIKDVDIFVLDRGSLTQDFLEKAFGYGATPLLAEATDYHVGRPARPVTQVYDFDEDVWPDGFTDFQVIVVKPGEGSKNFPVYVLQDFDLGICRIYFDGKTLVRTPEYTQDEVTKTFTAYIPLSGRQLDLTKDRVARLSEKYPEFTSNLRYQEEELIS